ncbi:MAG: hypothetical protein AAGN35_23105 [Bacteroidota bacterium]
MGISDGNFQFIDFQFSIVLDGAREQLEIEQMENSPATREPVRRREKTGLKGAYIVIISGAGGTRQSEIGNQAIGNSFSSLVARSRRANWKSGIRQSEIL